MSELNAHRIRRGVDEDWRLFEYLGRVIVCRNEEPHPYREVRSSYPSGSPLLPDHVVGLVTVLALLGSNGEAGRTVYLAVAGAPAVRRELLGTAAPRHQRHCTALWTTRLKQVVVVLFGNGAGVGGGPRRTREYGALPRRSRWHWRTSPGKWEWARENASCSCSTGRGGTRPRSRGGPKGYTSSSYPRTPRSCNPRRGCGLEQRRSGEPLLRANRGWGGGTRGALRVVARAARGHSLVYPLPLVAQGGTIKQAYLAGLGIKHDESGNQHPPEGGPSPRTAP